MRNTESPEEVCRRALRQLNWYGVAVVAAALLVIFLLQGCAAYQEAFRTAHSSEYRKHRQTVLSDDRRRAYEQQQRARK